MSGHSEFAPIGNHNQPIPMPSVGGVGNDANQEANVQQVQQQGQPVVEEPNPPAARTLAQKLDSMLLKAANMAAKSVDDNSIAAATRTLKLSEADRDSLANAVHHARRTLRIVSDFTGREIASAFVADLSGRLSKNAVESARRRLDEAIAHAEKLFNEKRVVAKDDFEKKDVQQSLLSREVNAGNPVKPVGNFQLQRKEGVDAKKCVVTVARLQTSSIFMRDMYGRVNKKGWFKK